MQRRFTAVALASGNPMAPADGASPVRTSRPRSAPLRARPSTRPASTA